MGWFPFLSLTFLKTRAFLHNRNLISVFRKTTPHSFWFDKYILIQHQCGLNLSSINILWVRTVNCVKVCKCVDTVWIVSKNETLCRHKCTNPANCILRPFTLFLILFMACSACLRYYLSSTVIKLPILQKFFPFDQIFSTVLIKQWWAPDMNSAYYFWSPSTHKKIVQSLWINIWSVNKNCCAAICCCFYVNLWYDIYIISK